MSGTPSMARTLPRPSLGLFRVFRVVPGIGDLDRAILQSDTPDQGAATRPDRRHSAHVRGRQDRLPFGSPRTCRRLHGGGRFGHDFALQNAPPSKSAFRAPYRRSKAVRLMAFSTSAVAVCCCSASVRSRVRACTSSNSRTFSIAMTAWSAKVWTSSISRRVKPARRRSSHRKNADPPRFGAGGERRAGRGSRLIFGPSDSS